MVLWHIQEIARMGQFKSKGKKLPDWKHPIFGKIGEYDVIEFPLQEAIKNISLASNNSLSESDKNRVADASLSRILFIKKKNEILVREIDYIPEWNYLQTNAFDLSGISVLSPMNEFTGHLVVQKWNGAFVARGLFEGGRLIKVGKPRRPQACRREKKAQNAGRAIPGRQGIQHRRRATEIASRASRNGSR